jgi:hypothetical protein
MIAQAALLALGSNMLLMYWYAGFTRLMALPHLLVWGPLEVMLLMYLMAGASAPTIDEVMYICLVLAVNGLRGCENIERRSESVSWCSRQGALGEKWGSLVS